MGSRIESGRRRMECTIFNSSHNRVDIIISIHGPLLLSQFRRMMV